MGDLQLNMTRFMSAISIHAILLNESFQSITLMKFTLKHPLSEGRKRNFMIGFCQAISSFGTELVSILFICTLKTSQEVIINFVALSIIT
jgi:hypothetical protein